MIKDISSVKIGAIWNSAPGAVFKENIVTTPDFGEEVALKSPLTCDLMLVRMKDGVMAVMTDFSTSVLQNCSRCLDQFTQDIQVEAFERHFFDHIPHQGYDNLETFLISQKDMSIDLTESLRQEIILHFPMIPVCSERCQGLCPSCTVNLNHETHKKGCTEAQKEVTAKEEIADSQKPFAHLKDLFSK